MSSGGLTAQDAAKLGAEYDAWWTVARADLVNENAIGPRFNPFAVQISAAGCSTLTYNLTVTATTTESRQLGGC